MREENEKVTVLEHDFINEKTATSSLENQNKNDTKKKTKNIREITDETKEFYFVQLMVGIWFYAPKIYLFSNLNDTKVQTRLTK